MVFKHVDKNEDSKITIEEAEAAGAPPEAHKILSFMDCNGDEAVSRREFRLTLKQYRCGPPNFSGSNNACKKV